MQLLPNELALANLKGEITEYERGYSTKPSAYEQLKRLSGKDFGYDILLWEAWVKEANSDFPSKFSKK